MNAGCVKSSMILQVGVFHVRQQPGLGRKAQRRKTRRNGGLRIGRRQIPPRPSKLCSASPNCFILFCALAVPRRFAGRLHGRQQQRDQQADYRDHDQ